MGILKRSGAIFFGNKINLELKIKNKFQPKWSYFA